MDNFIYLIASWDEILQELHPFADLLSSDLQGRKYQVNSNLLPMKFKSIHMLRIEGNSIGPYPFSEAVAVSSLAPSCSNMDVILLWKLRRLRTLLALLIAIFPCIPAAALFALRLYFIISASGSFCRLASLGVGAIILHCLQAKYSKFNLPNKPIQDSKKENKHKRKAGFPTLASLADADEGRSFNLFFGAAFLFLP